MIDYLTLDDVLAAAEAHLGDPAEVGDYGLLESAVARPQATVFGEDAYPTIHEKAAALLQSLAANHPLLDGNERTAFVATALFYGLNGAPCAGIGRGRIVRSGDCGGDRGDWTPCRRSPNGYRSSSAEIPPTPAR